MGKIARNAVRIAVAAGITAAVTLGASGSASANVQAAPPPGCTGGDFCAWPQVDFGGNMNSWSPNHTGCVDMVAGDGYYKNSFHNGTAHKVTVYNWRDCTGGSVTIAPGSSYSGIQGGAWRYASGPQPVRPGGAQ
ncbi:peptidase inhibitor family I36 protein [Streptomyces sp. 8N114]|uniref:peptidase inhibitor family I36 protein n=1 Tax=Streptomyces sp. 8N114 TaxID=3457419 RepID=UPI003FD043C0